MIEQFEQGLNNLSIVWGVKG